MLNIKSLLTKIMTEAVFVDTNLLRGASALANGGGLWSTGTFRNSGSGGTIAYNQAITPPSGYNLPTKGAIITATAANTQIGFCQDGCPSEKKQMTQSVWVKGNNGDKVVLQPIWSGTSGQEESGNSTITLSDSNWHLLTYTKTPNYAHSSVSLGYVYYYAAATNNKLYVIAPKVEYGSIATGWFGSVQMSGDLLTSFKSQKIVGSGMASSNNVPSLFSELFSTRTCSMGSVNITTSYTTDNFIVPASWYNYIFFYDVNDPMLLLMGMTVSQRTYLIGPRVVSSSSTNNCGVVSLFVDNIITKGNMSNTTTTNYNLNGTAGTHYYYVKFGNVVTVNFNVKCTTPSSSMTIFASGLPSHNHPNPIYFSLSSETANTPPIWAYVNSSGQIAASKGTAGRYFYGSVSYITNS